jgi:uncharacterized Rmd1/YagE family protein
MDCCAFCTSASYPTKAFYEDFRTQGRKTSIYKDAIHAELNCNNTVVDAFFFSYGVAVFWGLDKAQGLDLLVKELPEYAPELNEHVETDEFTYLYNHTPKIFEDEISLPNGDILTKLAFSHGIAQSVKLGTFETSIQQTFNATKQIPEELAEKGKIPLSRREIRRKMGELFIARNSINLHMDVLDTPEFFWEYPELEPLYMLMANYLDIRTRVEVLNQRLDVVHGLFEMLGTELNHLHSSRLEWTIICLIVIEVLVSLLRDVFRVI